MSDGDERTPIDGEGKPLQPRARPGYYPSYSTLSQRAFWDDATRREIEKRIAEVPPIRFFDADEAALLTAIVDRILPQDDRDASTRIPIVPWIDERLAAGRIDGYRYEDMPPDGEAHRLGLRAIDDCARVACGRGFRDLGAHDQEMILKSIHDGEPAGGHDVWRRMKTHRYWLLLLHDVCAVYYAHPFAWDEIGFGGPAYPRGYMRLEGGEPEPWESDEERYEWRAPRQSPSAAITPVAGHAHYGSPGQGGTH